MSVKKIELTRIRMDGGTQVRAGLSHSLVSEYAELMRDKDKRGEFPPVKVVYDGTDYWLADGFHRVEAAKAAKWKSVGCEILEGSKRDAILVGAESNRCHGARMTNADKKSLACRLLEDAEWSQWSNRKLADLCGASEAFVRGLRAGSLRTVRSEEPAEPAKDPENTQVRYISKHGTVSQMSVPKKPRERIKTVEVNGVKLAAHQPLEIPKQGGRLEDPAPVARSEPKPSQGSAQGGTPVLDGTGIPVAEDLRQVFSIREECGSVLRTVSGIMTRLRELSSLPGGEKLESILNQCKVDCENLRRAVRFATPHQACPYCHRNVGPANANCKACRGLGWVCEGVAKNAPSEVA